MTTQTQDTPMRPNIHHGSATVVGTDKGWMLPGCREVRSEATAKMMAIRMSKIMDKAEVGK